MLYYVKTNRLFKNLEIDGYKFFFDASTLEHEKTFEKKGIIYKFKEKRKDGVVVFNVFTSKKGERTKIEKYFKNT
ncbi:MAG: hypothetical protein QW272_05255 [Candidatus Methanomethylicaceae archaeon]